MDIQTQISIRRKKLGVLIRDARLTTRRNLEECAQAIGVTRGVLRAYEEGRKSPSLPELEILVYYLGLEMDHFWGKQARSDDAPPTEPLDLHRLIGLRQRMLGALLRQERMKASITMKTLSENSGISLGRIKAFELGERPIPLPELEGLVAALGAPIEPFFDHSGPIGEWMTRQKAMKDFLELPAEMQAFVCQPVNRPYLEVARKLSEMSTEKLRSVAETLLDITL